MFPGVVIVVLFFVCGLVFLASGIAMLLRSRRISERFLEWRLPQRGPDEAQPGGIRRLRESTIRAYASPTSLMIGGVLCVLAGLLLLAVVVMTIITVIKA